MKGFSGSVIIRALPVSLLLTCLETRKRIESRRIKGLVPEQLWVEEGTKLGMKRAHFSFIGD